jgi:hypothetical protein
VGSSQCEQHHQQHQRTTGAAAGTRAAQHFMCTGAMEVVKDVADSDQQLDSILLVVYKPGEQTIPPTFGDLFEPMAEGIGVRGGWQVPSDPLVRPLMPGAAIALPALLGMLLNRREAGLD